MGSTTAQFSIYKISHEEVRKVFSIEPEKTGLEYTSIVTNTLIDSVIKLIRRRPHSQVYRVAYKGMRGVFFKTIHNPAWEGIARLIIDGNEYNKEQGELGNEFLKNTNVSYVLFYSHREDIYAVTGGYGSNYIGKFIEKNYGLYLIPKLIRPDNPVVKSITQNNLLGNQTATKRTNKKTTSIRIEQDMSSIFRELDIEADRDIVSELGIEFEDDEPADKRINIANKDSLVIRRGISLVELKSLLSKLYDLEREPDGFALNYLVSAKKKRINNSTLFEQLINVLIKSEYDRFILAGDDYTVFYTGADRYVVADENGEVVIDQSTPIQFDEIMQKLSSRKITKTSLRTMLKQWTLSTFDNSGNPVILEKRVFDGIQGFVEYGTKNTPYYLFNGQWYVFDDRFADILKKEFKNLVDEQETEANTVAKNFGLIHVTSSEEVYNSWLLDHLDKVVAHTVQNDNIEIADAIFWDDSTVYLMHNKGKFGGAGARDVTNQVLASAEYLQKNLAMIGRKEFLSSYYDNVESKYRRLRKSLSITKEQFIAAFDGGRSICYLIGYAKNFSNKSRSTYAKYLSIETKKKLLGKGYRCLILALSGSSV